MKYAFLCALLVSSVGCAGTHTKNIGLGVVTDGDTTGGTAGFSTIANEKFGLGGFGEVAVTGLGSDEDEYDGFPVPGPESVLSQEKDSGVAGAGIRGGLTIKANDRIAFRAGLSLWQEEAWTDYGYETLFPAGSGSYSVTEDDEWRVGGVFGISFLSEEGILSVDFDTATESIGISFGLNF